jgi:hypothetical protein
LLPQIYHELAGLQELRFNWRDKVPPNSLATSLSGAMQHYPDRDLLLAMYHVPQVGDKHWPPVMMILVTSVQLSLAPQPCQHALSLVCRKRHECCYSPAHKFKMCMHLLKCIHLSGTHHHHHHHHCGMLVNALCHVADAAL